MKTVLNQLCVEKEGERERKGKEEERREDLRGVVEVGGGNKEDGGEGECVNDAALLRNVSHGRQFMPQVSNMVDVMVLLEAGTMNRG